MWLVMETLFWMLSPRRSDVISCRDTDIYTLMCTAEKMRMTIASACIKFCCANKVLPNRRILWIFFSFPVSFKKGVLTQLKYAVNYFARMKMFIILKKEIELLGIFSDQTSSENCCCSRNVHSTLLTCRYFDTRKITKEKIGKNVYKWWNGKFPIKKRIQKCWKLHEQLEKHIDYLKMWRVTNKYLLAINYNIFISSLLKILNKSSYHGFHNFV